MAQDEAVKADTKQAKIAKIASAETEALPKPRAGFQFSRSIAVLSDPGGPQAESIGAMRTHLLAQHIRDGRRSLAVCAPSAGVGCTYLTVNLATAFALAGLKTLLIDANMRDPSVQDYIAPSNPDLIGLRQCLSGSTLMLSEAINEEVLPNLAVMYAGGVAENPQELLASSTFKSIAEDCMRDFEVTIIDTPPSNGSADARRVAMVLRYALLVVKRNESFVADLRTLADELQSDRAKIVGTFLNDF